MKKRWFTALILSLAVLFACNDRADNNPAPGAASDTPAMDDPNEGMTGFDCSSLALDNTVYTIAQSLVDRGGNDNIWNLSHVDSMASFNFEDHFTNPHTRERLVLLNGEAGGSAGSADKLLMLLTCSDTLQVIWAGQVGDIRKEDIVDLNGDGLKEIIARAGATWMGECTDSYRIFNFKDGNYNILYAALSSSVLDCGLESLANTCKKGDTLQTQFDCSLVKRDDRRCQVQQVRTVRVHKGGQTDKEIKHNLAVSTDTVIVELK